MDQSICTAPRHEPWNKGKLVGQKAPQKLKEIWAIRVRLQLEERMRELALFNLAIDRAEDKRRELQAQQPEAHKSAKVLSILPKAAELYRRQVQLGLDGNPREALKARVFLREWFTGRIRLEPLPDGGLMAHWNQNATALLRNCERVVAGGRYELYSAYSIRISAVAASVDATR